MSNSLKEKIRAKTTKKPMGIFEKINTFLNRTIEIPIVPAVICSFILLALLYLPFNTPKSTSYYKSIIGCSEYRVIELGNMSVIVNKDFKGGAKTYEENH